MTFDEMIASISLRPGMWVGTGRLRDVAIFIEGYCSGLASIAGESPLAGWRDWIETRYLISHPAWHWTSILRHIYGSDSAALAALPDLFAQYKSETKGCSPDLLAERHQQAFLRAYGVGFHSPGDPPVPES